MNASMYACMRPCIHASTHASMYPCIHAFMYTSMHASIHASMHPCIRACVHASIQQCIHPQVSKGTSTPQRVIHGCGLSQQAQMGGSGGSECKIFSQQDAVPCESRVENYAECSSSRSQIYFKEDFSLAWKL